MVCPNCKTHDARLEETTLKCTDNIKGMYFEQAYELLDKQAILELEESRILCAYCSRDMEEEQ
jgi:hypothetical protein